MDTFFNLLYFVIMSLSVCVMWNFSKIFNPFRNLISRIPYVRVPLLCPECSSFWFGILCSFVYNPVVLNYDFFIISNIFCGLIVYLFAHFIFKNEKINIENKFNFIK
jgi:hypothetical protein